MMLRRLASATGSILALAIVCSISAAAALSIDETPARDNEWGFRPADGNTIQVTPPGFSWRPQENAASYEIQCLPGDDDAAPGYGAGGITLNVHTPPQTFAPGRWRWRFRY